MSEKKREVIHEVKEAAREERADAVTKEDIRKAQSVLDKYRQGKSAFDNKVIENEKWWRGRHWEVVTSRAKLDDDAKAKQATRVHPTSSWLFNSLANKHADLVDNEPEANVLAREQGDEEDAKKIEVVLPCILKNNNFSKTYSTLCWQLIKTGLAAVYVDWDKNLANGLGDIFVSSVDVLRLFWDPSVDDIQKSRYFFATEIRDKELVTEEFPEAEGKISGGVLGTLKYDNPETDADTDKAEIVNWFYRKNGQLHMCRYCEDVILWSSENAGLEYYAKHGLYPFVLMPLFPEEGSCFAFSYLDIMKSPQMYIDKLNQLYLEVAAHGKPRMLVKKSASLDKADLADLSKEIIEIDCSGSIDEVVKFLDKPAFGSENIRLLQMKIDELKETSANRDINQGGTAGGITAAAAISAIQEAGNKQSRDILSGIYGGFTQMCYLIIENMREHYDIARTFRITGADGNTEYMRFDNSNISDANGLESGAPVFDVEIKPQRKNPYSKAVQNELAKLLLSMGIFNPQTADQSLAVLDLMEFEGKQKTIEKVREGQTAAKTIAMLQTEIAKAMEVIRRLTGQNIAPTGNFAAPTADAGKAPEADTEGVERNEQRMSDGERPTTEYMRKTTDAALPKVL